MLPYGAFPNKSAAEKKLKLTAKAMNTGCQEKRPKNQREQTDGWAPCFCPRGWLEPKQSGYRGQVSALFPARMRNSAQSGAANRAYGEQPRGKTYTSLAWIPHPAVRQLGSSAGQLAAVSPVLGWTLASFTCILHEGLRFCCTGEFN